MHDDAYAGRSRAVLRNAEDFNYRQGGKDLLPAVRPDGAGYRAAFAVALQVS